MSVEPGIFLQTIGSDGEVDFNFTTLHFFLNVANSDSSQSDPNISKDKMMKMLPCTSNAPQRKRQIVSVPGMSGGLDILSIVEQKTNLIEYERFEQTYEFTFDLSKWIDGYIEIAATYNETKEELERLQDLVDSGNATAVDWIAYRACLTVFNQISQDVLPEMLDFADLSIAQRSYPYLFENCVKPWFMDKLHGKRCKLTMVARDDEEDNELDGSDFFRQGFCHISFGHDGGSSVIVRFTFDLEPFAVRKASANVENGMYIINAGANASTFRLFSYSLLNNNQNATVKVSYTNKEMTFDVPTFTLNAGDFEGVESQEAADEILEEKINDALKTSIGYFPEAYLPTDTDVEIIVSGLASDCFARMEFSESILK